MNLKWKSHAFWIMQCVQEHRHRARFGSRCITCLFFFLLMLSYRQEKTWSSLCWCGRFIEEQKPGAQTEKKTTQTPHTSIKYDTSQETHQTVSGKTLKYIEYTCTSEFLGPLSSLSFWTWWNISFFLFFLFWYIYIILNILPVLTCLCGVSHTFLWVPLGSPVSSYKYASCCIGYT